MKTDLNTGKRGDEAQPHILFALGGADREGLWGKVAATLERRHSVALVQHADAAAIGEVVRASGHPIIIVAHGETAVRGACRAAVQAGPNAVRALALVGAVPPNEGALPTQPTLILLGRQSTGLSHELAVAAFERLPAGRIVELEDCGDEPQRDRPAAVVSGISWFVRDLHQPEDAHADR